MYLRLIIFLAINFGALGLGSWLMGEGPTSEWYSDLNKAPWTPPGWVFGAAWTTIMICFSFYMSKLWTEARGKRALIVLFGVQFILNVAWNPVFFNFHEVLAAMIIISALTLLVGFFFFFYWPNVTWNSFLILPYLIWLIIACSLNGYIYLQN